MNLINIYLLGNNDSIMFLIFFFLFITFGIPIILFILGATRKNKDTAKKFYIAGLVYLLIGLGICGTMMI